MDFSPTLLGTLDRVQNSKRAGPTGPKCMAKRASWTTRPADARRVRDNDPSLTTLDRLDLTRDAMGDFPPTTARLFQPSGRFAGSELEGALVHNTVVTGMSIDDLSRSRERSSGPQAFRHALKTLRGCALPLSLKMRNWEAVRSLVDALGDEDPQGGRAAGHGGVATHEIMVSKFDVAGIGDELGPERLEALLSLRMATQSSTTPPGFGTSITAPKTSGLTFPLANASCLTPASSAKLTQELTKPTKAKSTQKTVMSISTPQTTRMGRALSSAKLTARVLPGLISSRA